MLISILKRMNVQLSSIISAVNAFSVLVRVNSSFWVDCTCIHNMISF